MQDSYVAPYAGAWIEIPLFGFIVITLCVAPYAGAWIEIGRGAVGKSIQLVAPYAGAWIEITVLLSVPIKAKSLPTRERGLK